ncbi:MAG: DUF805 domain-containing protein [Polaribacter sp.]|uniref:DUF805 domain-containing protein n=1 Tax=Polaribacter sp. TaxID=1920175 RepID=UPI002F35BE64
MDWYLKVLKQYADFSGRARRKEFWMFMLFHFIIVLLIVFLMIFSTGYLDSNEEPNFVVLIVLLIYFLGTIVPTLAVTVRRLHDIGKSGTWYFISFIPYIGSFWLLILNCMDGESKSNKWGQNPKGLGNDIVIDQIGKE